MIGLKKIEAGRNRRMIRYVDVYQKLERERERDPMKLTQFIHFKCRYLIDIEKTEGGREK